MIYLVACIRINKARQSMLQAQHHKRVAGAQSRTCATGFGEQGGAEPACCTTVVYHVQAYLQICNMSWLHGILAHCSASAGMSGLRCRYPSH